MEEAPRSECKRFRQDLSAFVDETLPRRRWEQVGYHVAGCPDCRDEVADIRRLRRTLGAPEGDSTTTPMTLAQRLHGIAGDHVDAPLYMAGGPSCALPSRRRVRNRRIMQSGVAAAVVMASLFAIAILVAPEPPLISNPVKQAREQFSLSTTALSVNEAVGAVLLAHERGANFGRPRHRSARSTMVQAFEPISSSEAAALMDAEAPTHSGVQRVWISAGEDGFHAADVQVDELAGEGTSLVVLDATGSRFMSWFVPSGTCCEPPKKPSWTFYQYRGTDQVAGRWARVVEARNDDGARVARWWVDAANGLVLWSERYDGRGVPTIISGFTHLTLGEAHLADGHVETASMAPVSSSGGKGWCSGLPDCPTSLAGLPLAAYAPSDVRGHRSMRLFYSDGFQGLSVVWSEGQLHGGTSIRDHAAGFPEVAVWQVGDGVVSVATNGSTALLQQACNQLPEEQEWAPSVFEQIGRGLARLAGIH